MGIQGLMKLLSEECPGAIKELELESFTGRKIAIDASMAMYQFLIAVRTGGPNQFGTAMLTNESGEVTSHIQGMFNRTIKLLSAGIKPVYVFDGKPPLLKGGELEKRMARRAKAESELEAAKEADIADDIDKFSRRLVKVTRQHNDDCKELLRLMGVPVINAPCEAEAQCAELAKKGKVYATATEDMDALTFKTPKLIRKLTFSQTSKEKQPILEIDIQAVLGGLGLTYEQFVDLCILCGCDYCCSIKGIGPKTALKLIKTHKTIENIIEVLQKEKKHEIPVEWFTQKVPKKSLTEESTLNNDSTSDQKEDEATEETKEHDDIGGEKSEILQNEGQLMTDQQVQDEGCAEIKCSHETKETKETTETTTTSIADPNIEYEVIPPLFVQARALFTHCEVQDAANVELKWEPPNEAGLREFLIERMGFSVERVTSGIKKLQEVQQQKAQMRMDSFFAPIPMSESELKRKHEELKAKGKVDPKKNVGPAQKKKK